MSSTSGSAPATFLSHYCAQILPAGAVRDGLRWRSPDGTEWWPLVEGTLFYQLEFPQEGKAASLWLDSRALRQIDARRNPDGSMVFHHYRVAWRDVARSTDERSGIAAVLPPRSAAKDKAPKPLPEFGSAEDFPLQQALNQLKGKTVLASKTQTERKPEEAKTN